MPRCTVCSSTHHAEIDRALVADQSHRSVAKRYGLTESSVYRHKKEHLPEVLTEPLSATFGKRSEATDAPEAEAKQQPAHAPELRQMVVARDAAEDAHTTDMRTMLTISHVYTMKILRACDRWLTDPDNPDEYDLSPRAEDVWVHFEDLTDRTPAGYPKKKKARLSALLAQLGQATQPDPSGTGKPKPLVSVERGEAKIADTRELILKAIAELRNHADLLATIAAKVHTAQTVEAFQIAVMEEIGKADAPTQQAIFDRLDRRSRVGSLAR